MVIGVVAEVGAGIGDNKGWWRKWFGVVGWCIDTGGGVTSYTPVLWRGWDTRVFVVGLVVVLCNKVEISVDVRDGGLDGVCL